MENTQTATPPARRRPTIRDVAAAAGVSRGTVSRVINGGHWVSPTALEAVQAAIVTTGYRANQHARSLATGRSNSLAFLLTEPQERLFADPTFSMLLRGAAEALTSSSMTLAVLVAGTASERKNATEYIAAGHVDGVLLISSHESDPMLKILQSQQIPTVTCGVPLGYVGHVPSVSVAEESSARMMVEHLRSRGRRRIAMITGPMDTPGGRYRLEGYRDELGEEYDPALVAHGDWTQESGMIGMEDLLLRAPDLDAVFVASDLMAAGAMIALGRAGRSIPGDVAVAGFDDSGLAQALDPPLTTMRQPFDAISAEMVSTLVGLITGGPARSVTLPATLVVREST